MEGILDSGKTTEPQVTFSKAEVLRFGWVSAKANLRFFIPLLAMVGLVNAIPTLLELFQVAELFIVIPAGIIIGLVNLSLPLGFVRSTLNFCDNQELLLTDFLPSLRLIGRFLWTSILLGIGLGIITLMILMLSSVLLGRWLVPEQPGQSPTWLILAGYIFFAGPSYLLLPRYAFFIHFVVDHESSGLDALNGSWEITRGHWGNLLLFYVLLVGVNAIGALCILVGLFVTIPMAALSQTLVYRKLIPPGSFVPGVWVPRITPPASSQVPNP